MAEDNLIQKLNKLSFNSLDKLGIDWRSVVSSNPDLQADYTSLLTLKKDWIIINIDYSQLEAYMLASLSGDDKLIKAVNSGLDLHRVNTENLYHISYSEIETNLNNAKTPEETRVAQAIMDDFKTKRKATKSFTFSISYGAGKEKISMDLRIPTQDADKLLKNFYATYPKIRAWQGRTLLKAIKDGYLETPFGRRRATPKLYGRHEAYKAFIEEDYKTIQKLKTEKEYWSLREEFKQVLNTNIQSTATDMCSLAACKFKNWLKTANKRAELYFWIHDSNVLACHIDDAVEVIEKLRDFMENQVKYDNDPVNYRTSIEVGYNYEWVAEIERNEWLSTTDKKALLVSKLDKSLDEDLNKSFKMIIKSTSSDMTNFEEYIKTVKMSKEEYFNSLVEKLGIEGIDSPESYMVALNNCSPEEYEQSMGFDIEGDLGDEEV